MSPGQSRTGATVLECAIVFPVFLLLLIGLVVAGLGVFRYQEVAALAREGARWASVHGAMYQQSTGLTAATKKDVYDKAILPKATGLNLNKLSYDVTWSPDNQQGSLVTVTVTYRWIPEAFFGGRDLTSTSTVTMAY
jgi:Flp pilus assembly protein TadG